MTWKISVAGGNLSFSAAHFITLDGGYEPLHGHNYGVSAELTGPELAADSYLVDFGVVKARLRDLIAAVNHRFLLPLRNPYMRITEQTDAWEIRMRDGARFVLPKASVIPLPVDNATAERLAEYFAGRLWDDLRQLGHTHIATITIGVAETEMQTAYYTMRIPA